MAVIGSVLEVQSYDDILNKASADSLSGEKKYIIQDIDNNEEFEKTKAMLSLMRRLNEGRISGEEEGYISSDQVRAYFNGKKP